MGSNKKFNQQGIYYSKESLKNYIPIYFKGKFGHAGSLFSDSNIIKLPDKISIENCLFVSKSLSCQLPELFNNWFVLSSDTRMKRHALKKVCLKQNLVTQNHMVEKQLYIVQ